MKTIALVFSAMLIATSLAFTIGGAGETLAQDNPFDAISFPIAELGNCGSIAECKTYCDELGNRQQCVQWAQENGLMSQAGEQGPPPAAPQPEEIGPQPDAGIDEERARAVIAEQGGPGGCSTMAECHQFCNQPENNDTCMAFAVEHDLMPAEQAEKFRRLQNVEGPGGCQGIAECKAYCEDSAHAGECLAFAEEQGLLQGEEASRARRFMQAFSDGGGPGECSTPAECRRYCENPDNREECFAFAKERGLISEEQQRRFERVRRAEQIIHEQQAGPGGCQSNAECKRYCNQPENSMECTRFSYEQGFITEEEYRRLREQGERRHEDRERDTGDHRDFRMMNDAGTGMLKNLPPTVMSCVRGRLGGDLERRLRSGDVSVEDLKRVARACMEQTADEARRRFDEQVDETRRRHEEERRSFEERTTDERQRLESRQQDIRIEQERSFDEARERLYRESETETDVREDDRGSASPQSFFAGVIRLLQGLSVGR